jgi:hypothetical protein
MAESESLTTGRVIRRKRRPRFLPEAPRRASSRKLGDQEDALIEFIDLKREYWKPKERNRT